MHDILVGLQYGDEGKGKITHSLMKDKKYTHCVRYNGGPNAGHTIYYKGMKVVTHQIPTGIFYDVTCIIGSGCVVDIDKLKVEIMLLESLGIDVKNKLKISYNCHIIKSDHIKEDIKTDKVGSTKCGIRPVYRDKYNRKGLRVDKLDVNLDIDIIDPYIELNKNGVKAFFEGAQGFMLDIDWGNYPYVTSSSCLSSQACTSGISVKSINEIYGAAKIYNTYVGTKKFQPDEEVFKNLVELGNEKGSTTGRTRQCNWIDLDELEKGIVMNGVTTLIINKCDIIIILGIFKLYDKKELKEFETFDEMKKYISERFSFLKKIIFSSSSTEI